MGAGVPTAAPADSPVGVAAPAPPSPGPSGGADARPPSAACAGGTASGAAARCSAPVSYTHLTLPTICSV
eukprot:7806381-Alexandrium_andersonii.AAC.1